MVQPALRSMDRPEQKVPRSLAERLEAEMRANVRPEPTVSTLAARFAPGALRASKDPPQVSPHGTEPLPAWADDRRRIALPSRSIVAVLTTVAIAPAAILAGLLWLGGIRGPEATLEIGGLAVPSQQAAAAATPLLNAAPQAPAIALTAPATIAAKAGDAVGFAIAIDSADALPLRSVIAIRDLPTGATFSEGRPYGTLEWSLLPNEIAGLSLRLPQGLTGTSDLRIALVAADGAVLAQTMTRLEVSPNDAALVVRADEANRVDTLIAHGNDMIAVGYLAGARAYFKRAAEAGSAEAALALGATYDPAFIAEIGAQGIKADPAEAKIWYESAATLGLTDREAELARLRRDWAQGPAPEAPDTIAEPEEAAPAPVERPRDVATAEPDSGPLGRLVAAAAELTSKEQWVEVTSAVNIRADSSGEGTILKVLQKGTRLRVKGREGNWVQVANPATSEEGWIYTRFLKETDAPSRATPAALGGG